MNSNDPIGSARDLLRSARASEARSLLLRVIADRPRHRDAWELLAQSLNSHPPEGACRVLDPGAPDHPLERELAQQAGRPEIQQMRSLPALAALDPRTVTALEFLSLLRRRPLRRWSEEQAVLALRSDLADRVLEQRALSEFESEMLISIACLAHMSGYLWERDADREEGLLAMAAEVPDAVIALLGYRGTSELPDDARDLLAGFDGEDARPAGRGLLHQRLVAEPEEQRRLAEAIPCLTAVPDVESDPVRAMYEADPFPPWRSVPGGQGRAAGGRWPTLPVGDGSIPFPRDAEVLVAGCGTGKEAVTLSRDLPGSRLLAVDLSLASLSYAQWMLERMQLENVSFAQADITRLGSLGQTFDLVSSSGVLHHLEDPLEGWRVLTQCTRPGGFQFICLYSQLARRDIAAVRRLIEQQGLCDDIEDIRILREGLRELPEDHPATAVLGNSDFHSRGGIRDLLFHPVEHRFTVDRIADHLESLGLEFLGFQAGGPRQHLQLLSRYRALVPEDPFGTSLEGWRRFEEAEPDTFKGMYRMWLKRPE